MRKKTEESVWRVLVKRYTLTEFQENLLRRYAQAFMNWDEFGNLTAIDNEQDIVELHFDDSLAVTHGLDFSAVKSVADIGSGGGCPGIPLAIKFPNLRVYLLEVKHKKLLFLEKLIKELGLTNVELVPLDWRTFLRKTDFAIDVFCARASLAMTELVRMFKPASPYKNAQLVYWAARDWQVPKQTCQFVVQDWQYYVAGRMRRMIVLRHP